MIPQAAITHWRRVAPWQQDSHVEQDLILSRALVEMFQDPELNQWLLLRGGTALYKLFVNTPQRYSDDIDLVQRMAGPIGPLLDGIRKKLDPLFGIPKRENNPDNVTLRYRMESEIPPVTPIRLKVEINTREHFVVLEKTSLPLSIQSPWFEGRADIQTYALEELLATKLRALYQRSKGRDLFDLWFGLHMKEVEPRKIVNTFSHYMKVEGSTITRKLFESNLKAKADSRPFNEDLQPLLIPTIRYNAREAAEKVRKELLSLL